MKGELKERMEVATVVRASVLLRDHLGAKPCPAVSRLWYAARNPEARPGTRLRRDYAGLYWIRGWSYGTKRIQNRENLKTTSFVDF